MHHMHAKIMHGEKARWDLPKNATCCLKQILEATLHKTTVVRSLTSHLKKTSKTNKTSGTLFEKLLKFFYGPLHMDAPVLADQQELIYIRSVRTQDVVWRTCREWWMIGERERERERERVRERVKEIRAVSAT